MVEWRSTHCGWTGCSNESVQGQDIDRKQGLFFFDFIYNRVAKHNIEMRGEEYCSLCR
jgi:hypothetical protein